jgi:hypothetical protein
VAKLFGFQQAKTSISTQDEEIWSELRQSLRLQFPNPERTACPDATVLKHLAQGGMRLEEAEPWLDHFSRCSPCFLDFERLRSQAAHHRKLFWGGGAAAAIFIFGSLGFWFAYESQHNWTGTPAPSQAQGQPLAVTLHFEDVASTRDTGVGVKGKLQQVPARATSLTVYLPAGSGAGPYELAVLNNRADSVALRAFQGNARIENGATVLHAISDLSGLRPGTCVLAIRPLGGRWRYFQVDIS